MYSPWLKISNIKRRLNLSNLLKCDSGAIPASNRARHDVDSTGVGDEGGPAEPGVCDEMGGDNRTCYSRAGCYTRIKINY